MVSSADKAARALMEKMYPAAQVQHEAAIRSAVDAAGRPVPSKFARLRTPIDLQWGSGDSRPKRLARAGTAGLIAAHCDTAPSGGPCVVALTWESETVGETHLGEVRIQAGQRFGAATVDAEIAQLPEGAWVKAGAPSPANGATGVDVALTVEL